MNDRSVALLPIFRSDTQAKLLATLLLDPEREESIAALARAVDVAPPNAMKEVDRLLAAGLLQERRAGRTRLIRANTASPYHRPLAEILAHAFGPPHVVQDRLADIPGIERAMIVGSWAARFRGQPGPPPRDIDVVVVGAPPLRALRRANARMEEDLGMPVQVTVLDPGEWEHPTSGFAQAIRERPLVTVDLGEREGTR